MILDINALQALEGEDAAGLSNCGIIGFTCLQTDNNNANFCTLGTQAQANPTISPPINIGSNNGTNTFKSPFS
ncbi:hypothetical protein [Streptomyces sp. NPDC001250]|uniref:hypothetical protein n=1 Tax=unclassified Streptomyces TaxID=2593676 RepID=UPI003319693C